MNYTPINIHEASAYRSLFDDPIWGRAGGFLRGTFFGDARLLHEWAKDKNVIAFTARDEDDVVVGFAMVLPPGPMGVPAHIALLYVDQACRRQGVGGRLLDHVSDRFGEATVHLGSRHDDVGDFFERRNFVRVQWEPEKGPVTSSTVVSLRRLRAASQSARSMAASGWDFRSCTPFLMMGNFLFFLLVICVSVWSGRGFAHGMLRTVPLLPGLVYFSLACRTRHPPPGMPAAVIRAIVLLVNGINLAIAVQWFRLAGGLSSFALTASLLPVLGMALFIANMIWLIRSFRELR